MSDAGDESEERLGVREERHFPDDSPHSRAPLVRTRAILGAAAVYGIYRVAQTAIFEAIARPGNLLAWQRLIVAAADGVSMAAVIAVALWTTRAFPIGRRRRTRHVLIHATIGLGVAVVWIAVLLAVTVAIGGHLTWGIVVNSFAWLTSNLFAYAVLVALIHALTFQRRLRERDVQAATLRAELVAARLDALRAQLHPHFLFNTLNVISELIHIDPAAADAMVIRLARLLRTSIDFTGDHEVRFEHELEVLHAYVDLQRMRHGSRLCVEFAIDPRTLDALVPPLVLQPLVENALIHGIAARREAGHVTITSSISDDRLELSVHDDGPGFPRAIREGVGLRNTRNRLRALYGDHHSLSFSRNGGETEVRVTLPLSASRSDPSRGREP